MSLINDALKKAQRQRTEGNTPAPEISTPSDSQEPLHRVARREKPAGFRSQLMLVGGGAVAAVVLLGLGAMFYFRSPTEQPAPAPKSTNVASVTAAATPTATPAAAAPAVPVSASTPAAVPPSATPAVTPTPTQPVATVPAPASTPATAEPPAPTHAAPAPVAFVLPAPAAAVSAPAATPEPSPAAASAPAVTERPKPSTRMIGVIEHFRVGGIRVAGAESKVLMNDHVYRINDIVDFELGIRLTAIETKALTFEDSRGAIHVRTF